MQTNGWNGYAGAGAGTPAAAPVVALANHHSNTDEGIRNPLAVVPAANDDVARFMPVMAIEQAIQRRQIIVDATKALMQDGVDFGKIPGAGDRPTLLQPGADKLCNLFGLVIQYDVVKSEEDWTGEKHGGTPFFFYEVKGRAFRGDFLMGEGVGSCSSWESKYRWRKAERTCPNCGKANIRKSREEGWYCWKKTDGCGATFASNDPAIVNQETGRKLNADMADVVNTILKMAYKRCKVSTTINATSASEFFTQDVEDQGAPAVDDSPRGYSVDTYGAPYGTREAQQNVANQKLAEIREQAGKKWTNRGEMKRMFEALREEVGEHTYLGELGRFGVRKPEDFRNEDSAWACYNRMAEMATREVA